MHGKKFWSVSSVGLEHRLDRAGVVGSNPIHSTSLRKSTRKRVDFLFPKKATQSLDISRDKKE